MFHSKHRFLRTKQIKAQSTEGKSPHPALNAPIPLSELAVGQKASIQQIRGGQRLLSRLAALGFTPGAELEIIRKGSRGPLLISVRGSRVALGFGEAWHILVGGVEQEKPALTQELPHSQAIIALAGQPNVGKSTVFNCLTGLNQHVGNWTGKTVEQKMGYYRYQGRDFAVYDLPGTYSLSDNSEEERLARDFILKQKPDLVIVVADAANLEHNLYLVAEMLLLPAPIILALNMMDVAEREGFQIEPNVLESALGIPVVPMSAAYGQGIAALQETVLRMLEHQVRYQPRKPSILPAHQAVLDRLVELIAASVPEPYPANWVALKLLEGDGELTRLMQENLPPETWEAVYNLLYQHEDAILDIAGARYEWIARMMRAAVVEPKVTRQGMTARLDRVLTHPLFGTVALIGILGIAFWLTYSLGSPLQGWLSQAVSGAAQALRTHLSQAPRLAVEFLAGGLLGGIGMVLTFLPILAIFFAILGFMEDTGYMARVAFMTDRWMHSMGLHGKSFMPMLLGFGCNVPAVLGTRIIESKRARLLTILLIPLVPCTARMTVITILAALFFGSNASWVALGLVAFNLLILAGLGYLLHQAFFKNEHIPFIMELPLYHLPNWKSIGIYIWQNILGFLQKAGTTILAASLVVWGLAYFPSGNVMSSYLAGIGQFLEPIGRWMGFPWQTMVALLTSFVAKENTIATLGILYGNLSSLRSVLTAPAALAFMVFQMLFIPCVATVAAIQQETRSVKLTAASLGMMLALALGVSVLVYQAGRLL